MDIIKQAIQMEKEGEAYYKNQADKNKDTSLYKVCMMLADEEKRHAKILAEVSANMNYKLTESSIKKDVDSIFVNADDFKSEYKAFPGQLDVYKTALENEQKSIDLYEGYLADAQGDEKKLFGYLVKQEKEHYEIIDQLVKMLTNAKQWVESAEFGTRGEY